MTTPALPADFQVKFRDLSQIIRDWVAPYGGLKGKTVLDFGCGSGITAAGLALVDPSEAPELVVGVDINPEARACAGMLELATGRSGLPPNLLFEEIAPGDTTSHGPFDLIFSWSVMEHVNNRLFSGIVTDLVGKLRPGGLFFVQIAPLYFSAEGSHLWAVGYNNWEHLTNQFDDIEADIRAAEHLDAAQKESLWGMFRTLNRVTADDLIARLLLSGLTLEREQRNRSDIEPPHNLLTAYSREALETFQIVLLLRKPI